jgi:hypothetical protein
MKSGPTLFIIISIFIVVTATWDHPRSPDPGLWLVPQTDQTHDEEPHRQPALLRFSVTPAAQANTSNVTQTSVSNVA